MNKWEYHCISLRDEGGSTLGGPVSLSLIECIKMLDKYGGGGWELVSVDNNVAYFKKPKQEESCRLGEGTRHSG